MNIVQHFGVTWFHTINEPEGKNEDSGKKNAQFTHTQINSKKSSCLTQIQTTIQIIVIFDHLLKTAREKYNCVVANIRT